MNDKARQDRHILGTLGTADGRGVVRVEDRLDTDIDDAWSALTDPGRLARWLGRVEGDLEAGGQFRASFHDGWEGTGHVESCEPPGHLRLVMRDAEPGPGQPEEGTIEITLTADGEQTLLVWEERGMPVGYLAAYGAGIQLHVEDLVTHLSGGERSDGEARWKELLPSYTELADRLTP